MLITLDRTVIVVLPDVGKGVRLGLLEVVIGRVALLVSVMLADVELIELVVSKCLSRVKLEVRLATLMVLVATGDLSLVRLERRTEMAETSDALEAPSDKPVLLGNGVDGDVGKDVGENVLQD